jgi:dTDP-4-amino-4,6-dideoxygalactose transaminase
VIPFGNPSASYKSHRLEIEIAIKEVLESGNYILGKEVEEFENEFASFHGNNLHAVGVANGTDAIALSLRVPAQGNQNEVITTSHTAVATVAAIEQAGYKPVFADIDPITRCICPESLRSRISVKTRAIIPVHIFGQPCDMMEIMKIADEKNLFVLEDCAQAHAAEIHGKKVGVFGDLAAFSCYPTKNLGALGDGGVILSKTGQYAQKIKRLRQYGWNNQRESLAPGFNSRLDEIQAAILRVKLKHLAEDNEKRRQIADQYDQALRDLPLTLPHRSDAEKHAMHLYVIECEDRDDLLSHLRERGIGASLHYHLPVHRHQAYSGEIRGADDLPNTEAFYQRNLTLPLFPELEKESVEKIANEVHAWFDRT